MADSPAEPVRRPRLPGAWTRALLLAAVVGIVVAVASSDTLHRTLLDLFDVAEAIASAHPAWGVTLFVIFSALSAILAFFSTAVLSPVAVQTWGEPMSMLLLWMGWLIGGICAYGIGRSLGRGVVKTLIAEATLERFEEKISRQTSFGLILLFQLALPSEVPGYVLGLARYRFVKFVAALAIAELPYAVGTIYLGATFLERRTALLVAIAAAGAALTGWALYRLQKRLSA